MAGFIQNIIWNSVEGFVEAGKKSAGEYAGNALIKAGDLIESGGRGVGNSIEKKATGYGSALSGQTYQPSPKALPSTARKPVAKRSNSLPASSKPSASAVKKPTSSVPLGANKYPGGNHVNGTRKAITHGTGTAKNTVNGISGGATKALGGVTGGVVGGGQKALTSASSTAKTPMSKAGGSYPTPTRSNSLPKPYGGNSFPSSEKKTAVRPGAPKPFTLPGEQKKPSAAGIGNRKPYPGTNTIPGQGSKVPVQQQKMKPLPRLGPQVEQGKKMTHLAF
ncbi:hypothetical protein IQ06DRAFT_377008 [Phaeosphaeriaceae sp. SRC1lsM3a]|nr:hypothetical protein IQ06DRAFT_377008 [Stagonospora sp. SRC1lsM3a]